MPAVCPLIMFSRNVGENDTISLSVFDREIIGKDVFLCAQPSSVILPLTYSIAVNAR